MIWDFVAFYNVGLYSCCVLRYLFCWIIKVNSVFYSLVVSYCFLHKDSTIVFYVLFRHLALRLPFQNQCQQINRYVCRRGRDFKIVPPFSQLYTSTVDVICVELSPKTRYKQVCKGHQTPLMPGSEGLHFYVVIYIEYSIVIDIDTYE